VNVAAIVPAVFYVVVQILLIRNYVFLVGVHILHVTFDVAFVRLYLLSAGAVFLIGLKLRPIIREVLPVAYHILGIASNIPAILADIPRILVDVALVLPDVLGILDHIRIGSRRGRRTLSPRPCCQQSGKRKCSDAPFEKIYSIHGNRPSFHS
jgi:hypothetical protein